MKTCMGWAMILLLMTSVAFTLMVGAWGLLWGLFGTVLLLVCGWFASFIFGD